MIDLVGSRGIRILDDSIQTQNGMASILSHHGLQGQVELVHQGDGSLVFGLRAAAINQLLPDFDTLNLAARNHLNTEDSVLDLEKEILIALLGSPICIDFPSIGELSAQIHMRRNIVTAGRRTELNFDTAAAERPSDCWVYDEDAGFTVKPGISVILALRKATQPDLSGQIYSFSCYRATEYVILLAMAEELHDCNPELFAQLQAQCEQWVIRSGRFHDVFLREYGSQEYPFPSRYYVPGDRVWFRNPDESSSDVAGYEGSWVFYLGGGLFTNFWKRDRPYSLVDKCLEIYHWRHGIHRDANGDLAMDESVVERRVAETSQDPIETDRILRQMMRWRDPKGQYGEGGCIDTTREAPRWVCPGTADLRLHPLLAS